MITEKQLLEIGNALATMTEPKMSEMFNVDKLVNTICATIKDCTNEMRELVSNIVISTPIMN